MHQSPLTVWRFIDGKPGHEKQSQGLIQGLQACTSLNISTIPLRGSLLQRLKEGRRACSTFSKEALPQLLIGAGHSTHLPLLMAQRQYGGHSIILMKPSLPSLFFDFVLMPKHDQPHQHPNIIPTEGALAPAKVGRKQSNKGIILIGGPDKRNIWDNSKIKQQVQAICKAQTGIQWQLSNSRRTPEDFLKEGLNISNLKVIEWQNTPANWLIDQLAEASYCWVSQDSVSMLYEALSAQCAVGVLELTRKKGKDKIGQNLKRLIKEDTLTTFSSWDQSKALPRCPQVLEEHKRCAEIILKRINTTQ
ncbi:MAG: mitochondrial fission ELM1 family protein [Gammaproteobacteria bacterium]|nr:mitochondrial fission ELM1 family protein [Gammaproteobacteria bacterium]